MILTPDNEYIAVLDACVLMPMPVCDTLLRFAEEPAFYRLAWSKHILAEVAKGLTGPKFGYSKQQIDRRVDSMRLAFPEAEIEFPEKLIEAVAGLPDADDRHVVAAAIRSGANAIVTENVRDFPEEALLPYGLLVQTADDFLCHQFHLNPQLARDKVHQQAAGLKRPDDLFKGLTRLTPGFAHILHL